MKVLIDIDDEQHKALKQLYMERGIDGHTTDTPTMTALHSIIEAADARKSWDQVANL